MARFADPSRLRLHRAEPKRDRGVALAEAVATTVARLARCQSTLEGWSFQITVDMRHCRTLTLGFPAELRDDRRQLGNYYLMAREALERYRRRFQGGGA